MFHQVGIKIKLPNVLLIEEANVTDPISNIYVVEFELGIQSKPCSIDVIKLSHKVRRKTRYMLHANKLECRTRQ